MVIYVIVLGSFQLAFSQILRIDEGFSEQFLRFLKLFFLQSLSCHLQKRQRVLCGDLSFSALPGMEMVPHDALVCLLMVSAEVHQGDVFDVQIVTALDQLSVRFIILQPLLEGPAQLLVKLVQLQENAHVGGVQGKRLLHLLFRPLRIVAFVVIGKRQISVYGGKIRILLCGKLPELHGFLPLQLVIEQAAQIVGSLCRASVIDCKRKHSDILQLVGEAVIRRRFFRLPEKSAHILPQTASVICLIIVQHGLFLRAGIQQGSRFLKAAELRVISGGHQVIVREITHLFIQSNTKLCCSFFILRQ